MLSGFRQSLFAVGFGLLGALAQASDLPAGYESYISRPDILKLKPTAHPELGGDWAKLRRGHVEAVALLLEMYPDREIYFLARDSELLYDLARWVTRDDPVLSKRIHLLNISRANMRAEHVKDYLAQEGISESSLKAGKKVLFVDTGFSGTISRVISEYFPAELRKNLQTHLMSSSNADHPSIRVFLASINPAAPGLPPGSLHGSIVSYEHMPRYSDRSTKFEKYQDVWQPLSPLSAGADGVVSKDKALAYMEDLLSYASEKPTQELLAKRRLQWKRLRESASAEQVTQELKALLEAGPQDPFMEAMARDFIEIQHSSNGGEKKFSQLTVESVGLKPVVLTAGSQSNKNSLIKKYPEWASILENPEIGIEMLIKKQEFGKLGAITDAIHDQEFIEVLCEKLGNDSLLPGVRHFVEMLIEKGEAKMLHGLAKNAFLWPHTAKMKDQLKLLIEKGDAITLELLAEYTFSKPHTAGMRDLIRLLIEKGQEYTLRNLARFAFSQPHTADMKEELTLLIEKGGVSTVHELAINTFSQPHTVGMREQLRLVIEKGNGATREDIARHVFSRPHTADMKEELTLLINKGNGHVLQAIAEMVFLQPHTAGMKDQLKLVVEKAEPHTLHFFASRVFWEPHMAEMNDALRLLIERADSHALRALATGVFSRPHSVHMTDELRLLIEKADSFMLQDIAYGTFAQDHWRGPEVQVLRDAVKIQDPEARRAFLAKHWKGSACLSSSLKELLKKPAPAP